MGVLPPSGSQISCLGQDSAHADRGKDFLTAFSRKSIQQACFAQAVEKIVHVMLILERKVLGDIVQ